MKMSIVFLMVMFAAVLLSAGDYKVLLLGDIHFDAPRYHTSPDGKIKSRYSKPHSAMWANKQAHNFLSAAAKALDKEFPFVIQVGDFIEGYGATEAQRAEMMTDAFKTVKGFFPEHKLLAVKGNHDVRREMEKSVKGKIRKVAGWDHRTYVKNFLPLLAKELGRKKLDSNFILTHGKDLFIFYDGFANSARSMAFLKKALEVNATARNVFFITHLPVLACSTLDPAWLLPRYAQVAELLAQRNAIIICAHTHQKSLIKAKFGKNTLTQVVVSSISHQWNNGKPLELLAGDKEAFYGKIPPRKAKTKGVAALKKFLDSKELEIMNVYAFAFQGFAVMKVQDNGGVALEIFNNDSGKPALVMQLK